MFPYLLPWDLLWPPPVSRPGVASPSGQRGDPLPSRACTTGLTGAEPPAGWLSAGREQAEPVACTPFVFTDDGIRVQTVRYTLEDT